MPYIKFQTCKHSGSEEEDFEICFIYFYGLNLDPLVRGHLAPRDLQLNKIGERLLGNCFISNLKYLRQVVLKKKISEYFSIYFYGLNLGPPGRGNLGP